MSNVLEVDGSTFDAEVLGCDIPVLVDFWAEWCMPCKTLAPAVEETADDFVDQVKVVKVDVDSNEELAVRYGVRGIPSLLIFNNGEAAERMAGVQSKGTIAGKLKQVLAG